MKISTFQLLSWDYDIQHFLMLINVIMLCLCIFLPVSLFYLALYQIIFGFYQLMISSNVLLTSKILSEQIKFFRKLHVASAWIYVLFVVFFYAYISNDFLEKIVFFVIPQIFVTLYYLLTRQELKSRKRYFEMRPMVFVK